MEKKHIYFSMLSLLMLALIIGVSVYFSPKIHRKQNEQIQQLKYALIHNQSHQYIEIKNEIACVWRAEEDKKTYEIGFYAWAEELEDMPKMTKIFTVHSGRITWLDKNGNEINHEYIADYLYKLHWKKIKQSSHPLDLTDCLKIRYAEWDSKMYIYSDDIK